MLTPTGVRSEYGLTIHTAVGIVGWNVGVQSLLVLTPYRASRLPTAASDPSKQLYRFGVSRFSVT